MVNYIGMMNLMLYLLMGVAALIPLYFAFFKHTIWRMRGIEFYKLIIVANSGITSKIVKADELDTVIIKTETGEETIGPLERLREVARLDKRGIPTAIYISGLGLLSPKPEILKNKCSNCGAEISIKAPVLVGVSGKDVGLIRKYERLLALKARKMFGGVNQHTVALVAIIGIIAYLFFSGSFGGEHAATAAKAAKAGAVHVTPPKPYVINQTVP